MLYDASRIALHRPHRQPPVDPALFSGKSEALTAELARLAYWRFERNSGPLEQALAALGLIWECGFVDRQVHSYAFACRAESGTTYVAFRGTQSDNLSNPVTDMKAWRTRWPGPGRVHAGFAAAYCGKSPGHGRSLREQVADWLAKVAPQELVLTGHSLGAALATLCAADHAQARLVTIGSPRVGDRAFADTFKGREAARYVNCADVVTTVPPELGYRHVGELRYIDHSGMMRPGVPAPRTILIDRARASSHHARTYALRRGCIVMRSLADHAPINYVSALLGVRTG
jgi:hypothetical protein